MTSHSFANKPSYTLIEPLFNRLSGANCESMLSITYHEKYTQLFNTPKYPIENVWVKSTGCDSLKMFLWAKNQSFDSFLASFELLRIAVSSGICESVELALCEEKKASVP